MPSRPVPDDLPDPILVLGADGYLAWPLTCALLDAGVDVIGVDHLGGRDYRGRSVTPIATHADRAAATDAFAGDYTPRTDIDITRYRALLSVIDHHEPAAVANLAQIPSAPYSMRGPNAAWEVQRNNVRGALNLMWALHATGREDTHVLQLATMGEYGTPDAGIPEGFLDDGRPAPKEPGSIYHASKVSMTTNTLFLARTWGIPVTEIYQGIVYGVTTDATDGDARLRTRFDADPTFGTVLNRFTAQAAVGHPLTVYGAGGQTRAMLSLRDSIECLTRCLSVPPGPDAPGAHPYRAVNQFADAHRVLDLAELVAAETGAEVAHVANPRVEADDGHAYDPERHVLDALGYDPSQSVADAFRETYAVIADHTDRIDADALRPTTTWTGEPPRAD